MQNSALPCAFGSYVNCNWCPRGQIKQQKKLDMWVQRIPAWREQIWTAASCTATAAVSWDSTLRLDWLNRQSRFVWHQNRATHEASLQKRGMSWKLDEVIDRKNVDFKIYFWAESQQHCPIQCLAACR
jgi:hypothetical protein